MISAGFFLLSLGIFLVFIILITLLGYFFQFHLFKVIRTKRISLTILLESVGVGIVIFIFYSYLIIDFLKAFNFFTIYLPLIIFDSVNLLVILYKRKWFNKENYQNFIKRTRSFILDKKVKRHIIILIIIYSLLLLVQGVIETHLNLPSKDPYTWVDITLYLHKYGDLNYDNYTVHGIGFAIFTAGSLLIIGDFYIQYFYIKNISIFFLSIIVLVIYDLSSYLFKRDIEILITLLILLCFNSLLIRFSFAVPSIIATTLGIIFFNTLIHKDNLRLLLIRGILLGGMLLIHPLYFLFLFGYLIIYELILLIQNLRNNKNKSSDLISDFIKKYSFLLLITLVLSIPYFLNLLFSGKSLYKNFTRYLFRGYDAKLVSQITFSQSNKMIFLNLNPSRTDFLYNLIFFGFDIPINKTLNWGVIFLVLGLLYNINWNNPQKNYLINFIKFTFIFSFTMFLLNSFFFVINNNTILSLASFINQYGKRVFELFSPVWAILFILGVIKFFSYLEKIKINKLNKKSTIKERKSVEIGNTDNKTYLVLLLVFGVSLYSSHLYLQYNLLYTSHYDDDYLTEAVLYIGDYFNQENIEDETILLPDNYDSKVIFRLLYHRNLEREYLEFDHTNYTELMNETNEENADFVLVYKLEATDSCLEKIDERQEILYENPNYIFFKVK